MNPESKVETLYPNTLNPQRFVRVNSLLERRVKFTRYKPTSSEGQTTEKKCIRSEKCT